MVTALLILFFYRFSHLSRHEALVPRPVGSSNLMADGTVKAVVPSSPSAKPVFKSGDGQGEGGGAAPPHLTPFPGGAGDQFAPPPYYFQDREDEWCENAYGHSYLRRLMESRAEYCEDESTSSMTCFGVTIRKKHERDNFCVARKMAVDVSDDVKRPFSLDCKLRDFSGSGPEGPTPVANFRKYMFDTGPQETFRSWIQNITHPARGQLARAADACRNKENKNEWAILFKRDGTNAKGSHPWHGLMELFSLYLTLDVLRSGDNPMFTEADMDNAQVVLLDDFPPGDFFSLWSIFAKKPVIHTTELCQQLANGEKCLDNVVLPLPGASNPMWLGDWHPHNCRHSILLDVFINRLLVHYNVTHGSRAPDAKISVVFLERPKRRKLHDMDRHIENLRKRFPERVNIQAINLWDMDMSTRIKVVSEADILVGVHGSELTFAMFQPVGSSVVEIQPKGFNHFGFRNMAALRRQRYFKAHADFDEEKGWQKTEEVRIKEEDFVLLVASAIQSVLQRGTHSLDVL